MIQRKPPDFRRLYTFDWVSDSITDDAFDAVRALDKFADAEMGQ